MSNPEFGHLEYDTAAGAHFWRSSRGPQLSVPFTWREEDQQIEDAIFATREDKPTSNRWDYFKETPAVSTELKVTKERVVAAAAKCGDAARVLKELFPDAFAAKPIVLGGALKVGDITSAVAVRESGNYKGKSFYLPHYAYGAGYLTWHIVRDNEGVSVLVPTPKA